MGTAWPLRMGPISCPETSVTNGDCLTLEDGTNKLSWNVGNKLMGTAWPLKTGPISCLEESVTNYQPTPPSIPEERRTTRTGSQSFCIAIVFILVDWTNNNACKTSRYDYVHDLSPFYVHTHSFSSLFIASTTKGKDIWGRPPCSFTFYKNIRLKKFHVFPRFVTLTDRV
jgi:hypothetical protein